jgi:hypothetical protein
MIKKAFYSLLIGIAFASCSNKLDVIAPYKESVAVYGLLDQSDTIHYIRIERVFLGEGNAYIMAQNQDSVYFKPGDLKVTLERWRNGNKISVDVPASSSKEIVLTDTVMQEASGIFNQNERVYKTNHPLYANDSTCVYKLIIHNNRSGKEYTAQTALIGSFQLLAQGAGPINFLASTMHAGYAMNIVPMNGGQVTCFYNSPANAGVCGLTMRLHYTENTVAKTTDINLGTIYPSVSTIQQGGDKMDFSYQGGSLLSIIASTIPVDNSVTRDMTSVDFLLNAGGYDLALYNQVNASTSLSQNKANYSNINGGIGLFSSRHQSSPLSRAVSSMAKDTLSGSSITCKLRFLNHLGALSPCH